ncbi:MAG TPA: sulfatase-like hydrolase/transferase, partial [Planctomycetota bacterium]|nr:sulfatase-like hydrolase/transferase [Planctomycetota bacterium]
HDWIPFLSPMHLRASERTIAAELRDAGYATCHAGKWHLNGLFNLPGQPQPREHGFDHWFSAQNNALPNHQDPYNFVRNGIPVGPQSGTSSRIVADEAIRWLRESRDKSKPFFLYVCFHEPHEPISTEPRFADLYRSPDDPSRAAYYGNVTRMDEAFGRLMSELDGQGLRERTFVMFTSDNGPARTKYHNAGSAGPLRASKGHLYEGGIRVPGLVRWPGRVTPGTASDEPVSGVDFLPTVCAVAGLEPPRDRALDGTNVLPVLEGRGVRRATPLYWQYNWALSEPAVALRIGDWKVLGRLGERSAERTNITAEGNRVLKSAELAGFELYDLKTDLGETTDLSAREPGRLFEMSAALRKMYLEVREETPAWPVWTAPPYEAQRIRWPDYVARPLKER